MKIPVVLVLCLMLVASASDAQMMETPGTFAVGPAFEISVPAKSLADKVGTGFGGAACVQYVAMKNIALVARAGYISWSDKDVPNVTSKAHAIELLLGPKFAFGSGVYAGLDLGIYMASREFSVSGVEPLKVDETKAMAGAFIGYEFSGFDVGAKFYPFDSEYTNVTVSIGYWFGL